MVVEIDRCMLRLQQGLADCSDNVPIWSRSWGGSSHGGFLFHFSSVLCGKRIVALPLVVIGSIMAPRNNIEIQLFLDATSLV